MSPYDRLQLLGVQVPGLAPTDEFLRVNRIDDLAFVSGHALFEDGTFRYCGRVGREFDVPTGQRAAELAVLGCLVSLESSIGSLDCVRQIVKLNGYINCVGEFHDLPLITDAASKLVTDLVRVFGRCARTTVGVASLPKGVAVEIDLIVRIHAQDKVIDEA